MRPFIFLKNLSKRCCYPLILTMGSLLLSQDLMANDTTATVGAGGIEFHKTENISMDVEVLKISPERIEVAYEFNNHTSQPLEETVAFPLPPAPTPDGIWAAFPVWDEAYQANTFLASNAQSKEQPYLRNRNLMEVFQELSAQAPFLNFQRKTNGQKGRYNFQIIARDAQGKDITALLKKHMIPLSATFLMDPERDVLAQNPKLAQTLKKLGLLKGGEPAWTTQTIYFWKETFGPGTTQVEHSYRPGVGLYWLESKNKAQKPARLSDLMIGTKKWEDYAVDDEKAQRLVQMVQEGQPYRVREVHYVLTTGAHWKGPIKKFHLEIEAPSADTIVLFKFPSAIKRVNEKVYQVEVENFTPQEDLRILFVDPQKVS